MPRIFGDFLSGRVALGLLILRAVMGAALMLHGWTKIQAPFSWMDKMAHPAAPPLQALVALGEFGGGLGLLVGLLTPLAALGVMCTMAGIFFVVHRHAAWINPGGPSSELESLFFTMALLILLAGPGRYSLDAQIFGKRRR